jgi:hypothetical protein
MIQPQPLKNLLGEGSDLAKSPLTAAYNNVCKKSEHRWDFPLAEDAPSFYNGSCTWR